MKNWGKRRLLTLCRSAKVCMKTAWDGLVMFIHLYSVACLCDTRWVLRIVSPLPPPLRQGHRSIAAVAPSLQLNCGKSWQSSRTAIGIPAEPRRGPENSSSDGMCSSSRTARQNPQQWKSAYGCVWMFFSFCTTFYERPDRSALWPSLVARLHRAPAWTANAWPLTLCAC